MLIGLPDLGGASPEQGVSQGRGRRKWEDGTADVSQAPCRNLHVARNAVCWWSWSRPCCGSSRSGRDTTTSTDTFDLTKHNVPATPYAAGTPVW